MAVVLRAHSDSSVLELVQEAGYHYEAIDHTYGEWETLDLADNTVYYLHAASEAQLAGLFTIFDSNADSVQIQLIYERVMVIKMNRRMQFNLMILTDSLQLGNIAAGATVYFYVDDAKMEFVRIGMMGNETNTIQSGSWTGIYTRGKQIRSADSATKTVQPTKLWLNVLAVQVAKKAANVKTAVTVSFTSTVSNIVKTVKANVTVKKKLTTKSLTLTSASNRTIAKGESFHFFATASPVSTTDKLSVSSSNSSVAKVSCSDCAEKSGRFSQQDLGFFF